MLGPKHLARWARNHVDARTVARPSCAAILIISLIHAVSAQTFVDNFNDGNHRDGNPVRWLTDPGGFAPGTYTSNSGDFVFLSDPVNDDETMLAWVDGRTYTNRGSVRVVTQLLPFVDGEFTGEGNVGATLFFDPTTISGYAGAIDANGTLYLVTSVAAELTTLGEIETGIDAHQPTVVQLEHDGVNVSLSAWALGSQQPTTPQLTFADRSFTRGAAGLVLVEDAANDVAIFNRVHVATNRIIDGDVTGDGVVDDRDIDTLFDSIGSPNLVYDLDYDDSVTRFDVDYLVQQILGTKFGDANLDGHVDGIDLDIWQFNQFTASNGWNNGDFNGDGLVDGQDFNIWNSRVDVPGADFATIPEPGTLTLCAVGILLAGRRHKQK